MSDLGASTVTAWVKLVKGDVNYDPCSVVVHHDRTVELAKGAIVAALSSALTGVHPVQVKLFLSDEANIEVPFRSPTDTALKPNRTLRSEVLDRLNPTGAGAGAVFPATLYLVAVVEGACAGGGVVVWGGVRVLIPPPPPQARRVQISPLEQIFHYCSPSS